MSELLTGKRILITQADQFMGPMLCEVLRAKGATVIADDSDLSMAGVAEKVVADSGRIDVLVANLSIPAPSTPAAQVSEEEWQAVFAALVTPLPRLCAAVLPQMVERRAGKILLMGSASALRGIRRASTYSARRCAA